MLRLTVNGKRGTKTTGIQVAYADWDAKGQKIRGKSDLVRAYTARLTDLLAEANRHYFDLERAKLPVTPNRLRKLIAGEENQADETLLQSWDKWHERQLLRAAAGEILPATAKLPGRRRPLVEAWLKFIKQPDLLSREMTAPLARDFRRWLLTDYGRVKSGAHANKCARLLSECLSCALERSALAVHPLGKLKLPKVKKSQLVYLTTEQLQLLIRAELPNSGLRRTRDAFLLMCYTGMAWVDARAFEPDRHLTTDSQGQRWLHRPRTKTEVEAIIPLLPAAQGLLDKYKGEGRVPIPSNQKMNERLREIAALLHLPLRLTCHVGRRTFGMLALDAGVSLESVSAMLGHASIRITQELYAKVKEGRIGREMRDAGLL